MNAYLALTKNELRLAFRDKQVLFFNYLFPLIFFFLFATLMHAERGGAAITVVVTNVLVIAVLGNGFFGAAIRAVQEREQNILRRFKVAPITPVPILAASITTGLLLFLPTIAIVYVIAHQFYGLPMPARPLSIVTFFAIGAVAFRAIGLIIAAVANTTAESNLLVQILYMPMMFLGGATFPISALPRWLQTAGTFFPSTYLVSGVQSIVTEQQSLVTVWKAVAALLLTLVIGVFVASRLFRWEKDEKLKPAAKLWVAGVLAPFIALGVYQVQSNEQVVRNRVQWRQLQRDDSFLIRNAKIFVGDGRIIESGSLLVRHGKIEKIFDGPAPDGAALKADVIEASGKTVLPGLIDVHVHLGAPAGVLSDFTISMTDHYLERALAQYLYSGVTTVKSVGDQLGTSLTLRTRIRNGEFLGSEFVICGPLFTTEGGHGTEYFTWLDGPAKAQAVAEFVRAPKSPDEARQQVRDLKRAGVDGIKAVLESGRTGMLFERMDTAIFRAVIDEANQQRLPAVVHTGSARDVADVVAAHGSGVEHGSFSDQIPDAVLAQMAKDGVAYDPTLTVLEAQRDVAAGRQDLLRRSLVQQAVPQKLLSDTAAFLKEGKATNDARAAAIEGARKLAAENLVRAWRAGVPLVTGSDAGNLLVFHGPTVHREMQLWVEAGVPPSVALQAATYNAARLLRQETRIGRVAEGYDANLLVVDGDPTRDIAATERVSLVILKGERVRRSDLFDPNRNPLQ
ncbi:MAG TPA: amidohydrolase family protein [Vicinamibacterales bacterium]|nr:amidohydrolase family protein [Vicinamibacterales bacterium]